MSRREEQSNGQTNQVKSTHFSYNYKSRKTCIEAIVSKNYIQFHLYKRLFPKVDNTYIRQQNTCKVKLRYNEQEKYASFCSTQWQQGSARYVGY